MVVLVLYKLDDSTLASPSAVCSSPLKLFLVFAIELLFLWIFRLAHLRQLILGTKPTQLRQINEADVCSGQI